MPTGDSNTIVLTDAEIALADACARRKQESGRKHYKDRQGKRELRSDVVGARGELAAYKWVGIPFECHVKPDKVDGDLLGIEVKTAASAYGLVVHENDPDRRPIMAVLGDGSTYRMIGWIRAEEGKRPEYWRNPGGRRAAWFVPLDKLRPIGPLLEVLRSRAVTRGLIDARPEATEATEAATTGHGGG